MTVSGFQSYAKAVHEAICQTDPRFVRECSTIIAEYGIGAQAVHRLRDELLQKTEHLHSKSDLVYISSAADKKSSQETRQALRQWIGTEVTPDFLLERLATVSNEILEILKSLEDLTISEELLQTCEG